MPRASSTIARVDRDGTAYADGDDGWTSALPQGWYARFDNGLNSIVTAGPYRSRRDAVVALRAYLIERPKRSARAATG
jgi:hypothetical protein